MASNVPDKLMETLPKSFLIVIILSGLILCLSSPVWLVIKNWLSGLAPQQSLTDTISGFAILLGFSLVAGIAALILETPLVGDDGFYHNVNILIKGGKPQGNPHQKGDTKFLWQITFYSWLHEQGCPKYLEDLNLKNAIVNSLILGFTLSFFLNLITLPLLLAAQSYVNWGIVATYITLVTSLSLLYYNKKYWQPEKKAVLAPISEEFKKYLDNKESQTIKNKPSTVLGYDMA